MSESHVSWFAAFAVVTSACSGAESSAAKHAVRDSAGVTIVESRTPERTEGNQWHVADVITRFDTIELAGVVGAVRLPDNRVVVAEEGGARLLFFRADGALEQVVGQRGDGPAEFRLLQNIGHRRDTVWVYDYVHARLTRFHSSGDLIGTVNLTPPLPAALSIGELSDGSHVVMGQWHSNRARDAQGLLRDTVAVMRYVDGRRTDSLALTPGREFIQRADETGRMVMSAAVFGRRSSAATWDDAVVFGDQVDHSLALVGSDGQVRRLIRWHGPDLRLARTDVDAWVSARVAATHRDQREKLRVLFSSAPVPARQPSYSRFLVTNGGSLWVSEYSPDDMEPARWDVFSREGVWLSTVENRERLRLLDIGPDWILVTRLDSLGVERIELRELRSS